MIVRLELDSVLCFGISTSPSLRPEPTPRSAAFDMDTYCSIFGHMSDEQRSELEKRERHHGGLGPTWCAAVVRCGGCDEGPFRPSRSSSRSTGGGSLGDVGEAEEGGVQAHLATDKV